MANPNPIIPSNPAGRAPGTRARAREMAMENFKKAVEVCHQAKASPPDILMETVQIIRMIALAPVSNIRDAEARRLAIMALGEHDKDRLIRRLMQGADVLTKLMEFAYPKLQRVDHAMSGEFTMKHENHMIVELKIGEDRPTIDLDDEVPRIARSGHNGGSNGGTSSVPY